MASTPESEPKFGYRSPGGGGTTVIVVGARGDRGDGFTSGRSSMTSTSTRAMSGSNLLTDVGTRRLPQLESLTIVQTATTSAGTINVEPPASIIPVPAAIMIPARPSAQEPSTPPPTSGPPTTRSAPASKALISNMPSLTVAASGPGSPGGTATAIEIPRVVRLGSTRAMGTSDSGLLGNGNNRVANTIDVWALGVVIVIGGQFISWNSGVAEVGVGSLICAVVVMGLAYLILIASMAEMAGALPFSGGAFGFSRATQGTYVGYLVGCCESIEYVLYVSSSVMFLGQLCTEIFHTHEVLEPLYWAAFYLPAVSLHVFSDRFLHTFNRYLAVLMLLITALYCAATVPIADFAKHAPLPINADGPVIARFFSGGFRAFVTTLPLTTWFYVGVEAVPMASEVTINPRQALPRGMMACMCTLLVSGLSLLMCVVSVGPSPVFVSQQLTPVTYGFATAFRVPARLKHWIELISLLATASTAYGFIFAYGRQCKAMSDSGLLPPVFGKVHATSGAPTGALVVGSLIGYGAALLLWGAVKDAAVVTFEVCITFALVTYVSQLLSYVKLRMECGSMERTYQSPFGITGACVATAIFLTTLVGSLFFLSRLPALLFILVYVLLTTVYYVARARHQQKFSRDEMLSMVAVYSERAKRQAEREHVQRLRDDPYYYQRTKKAEAEKKAAQATENSAPRAVSPLAVTDKLSPRSMGPQRQATMGGWSLNDAGIRFVGELNPVTEAAEHMDHIENGLIVVDDTSIFARAYISLLKAYNRFLYGAEEDEEEEDRNAHGNDKRLMAFLQQQEEEDHQRYNAGKPKTAGEEEAGKRRRGSGLYVAEREEGATSGTKLSSAPPQPGMLRSGTGLLVKSTSEVTLAT